MKKLTICLLLAAGLLMTAGTQAQSKVGYIDVQALIVAMPEFKKADTALAEYQNALNEQYMEMVKDFNLKDSVLGGPDTNKLTKAQIAVKRDELTQLYRKIQGWQQTAQQMYNQKEQELLQPVQTKAMKAVSDVAKETGYGFVFSRQALVVDPPVADDLMPAVKKKLGLK